MKRVLILEDQQEFIRELTGQLQRLLERHQEEIEIDVVQTQQMVETQINSLPAHYYDVILLDYYAPDGTFHALDIELHGAEKVIAMSSVQNKNELAEARGVKRSVVKQINRQGSVIKDIVEHVEEILFQ